MFSGGAVRASECLRAENGFIVCSGNSECVAHEMTITSEMCYERTFETCTVITLICFGTDLVSSDL